MARQLVSYVWLEDEEHGRVGFGPGDHVPAWAEALITNPDAWEGGSADATSTPAPRPETTTDPGGGSGSGGGGDGGGAQMEKPPKVGSGSGRDAWVAYAEQIGVEIPESANRAAVMAAVDAHGK